MDHPLYGGRPDTFTCPGVTAKPEDVARLSPLGSKHFNALGRYYFDLSDAVRRGELRPLRDPNEFVQKTAYRVTLVMHSGPIPFWSENSNLHPAQPIAGLSELWGASLQPGECESACHAESLDAPIECGLAWAKCACAGMAFAAYIPYSGRGAVVIVQHAAQALAPLEIPGGLTSRRELGKAA